MQVGKLLLHDPANKLFTGIRVTSACQNNGTIKGAKTKERENIFLS